MVHTRSLRGSSLVDNSKLPCRSPADDHRDAIGKTQGGDDNANGISALDPDRQPIENKVEPSTPGPTTAAAAAAGAGDQLRGDAPAAHQRGAGVAAVGAREHRRRVDVLVVVKDIRYKLWVARPRHDGWDQPSAHSNGPRGLDGDLNSDLSVCLRGT